MNLKVILFFLAASVFSLTWVLYQNVNADANQLDTSEMKAKVAELKEQLASLAEDYAALKSSLPVPVETQLTDIQNKLSELDSVVTDQSDLLRKLDPNGILQDTEEWISDSYEQAINLEENGWARVRAAEILERYNRMDEEAYESISDVYLSADNGRMKAYALGVIKESVSDEMKQPMIEDLDELTMDGEFKNGWLTYNLVDALGNFSSDPEVSKRLLYIAENHPEDNIARTAAEKIGATIEAN